MKVAFYLLLNTENREPPTVSFLSALPALQIITSPTSQSFSKCLSSRQTHLQSVFPCFSLSLLRCLAPVNKKGSRVSESNGTLKGTFFLRNFAQLGSPTKSYCFTHSLDLSNTGESTGPVISALRIRPHFWSPNVFRNLIFLFLSWNKFFMFWSPGGTKSTSYPMRTGSFCFRKPNCR